jgi:hypothetical protein
MQESDWNCDGIVMVRKKSNHFGAEWTEVATGIAWSTERLENS